jgi:WS/DGAT/MGAT family acyltransferase
MRRLSATDAALLHGETAAWHLHVSSLLVLDPTTIPGGYRFEDFRDALSARLRSVPRFRQTVAEVPFGLDRPVWVDAGDFDPRRHIRHVAVPAPGGREELFKLAGALASSKIDRSGPLWECWVLEGPSEKELALLVKSHHVLFDGVGGLDAMRALFDLSADGPDTLPDPAPATDDASPGSIGLLWRAASRAITAQPPSTLRVVRQLVRQAGPLLRAALTGSRPLSGLDVPANPFGGRVTPERVMAGTSLPMPVVKAIGKAAGVTVNDVLLATLGGALRSYLEARGRLPQRPLVGNVAVSTRSGTGPRDAGNQYGVMFATLATHIKDPAQRLAAVRASSTKAKALADQLARGRETTLSAAGPPAVVSALAWAYGAAGLDQRLPLIGNVGVSNVPGPPVELFVCGAAVQGIYVLGPLMLNSVINFTAISGKDNLDVGLNTSPGVVPDILALADEIGPALLELSDALGLDAARR